MTSRNPHRSGRPRKSAGSVAITSGKPYYRPRLTDGQQHPVTVTTLDGQFLRTDMPAPLTVPGPHVTPATAWLARQGAITPPPATRTVSVRRQPPATPAPTRNPASRGVASSEQVRYDAQSDAVKLSGFTVDK